ncbi:MAG: P-II family nitrogen regulator [Spirochaetales bacterium]
MQKSKKIAVAVVPEQCCDSLLKVVKKNGGTTTMILDGRGTAEKLLLQQLGLGQTKKSLICVLEEKRICDAVCEAIKKDMCMQTEYTGIVFTIFTEDYTVEKKTDHLVICVIVNAGYGEEVMQAGRKAGARGGTIVNARGTGSGHEMDFFGIQIIPEKEMLIMVAECELARKIIDSVNVLPILQAPGSGIVFTLPVADYERLGTIPQ